MRSLMLFSDMISSSTGGSSLVTVLVVAMSGVGCIVSVIVAAAVLSIKRRLKGTHCLQNEVMHRVKSA